MAGTSSDAIYVCSDSDDDDDVQITAQIAATKPKRKRARTSPIVPDIVTPILSDDSEDDAMVEVLSGRAFIDTIEVVNLMFKQLDKAMVTVKETLSTAPQQNPEVLDMLQLNGSGYSRHDPISRTSVRLLLNYFKWDTDSLINRLKTDGLDKVFQDCGVINPRLYFMQEVLSQDPSANGRTNGTGKEKCGIMAFCDDDIRNDELYYVKPCCHTFCFDCLAQHVITTINDNQAVVDCIPCPSPGCKVVLDDDVVLGLLCHGHSDGDQNIDPNAPASDTPLKKYHRVIGTKFVEHNKYLTLCPTADCSKVAQLFNNPNTEAIECPDCLALFCFMCGGNWHEPLTCDQVKQFDSFDDKSLLWITQNTKKCPKCKWPIQKTDGCDHMTCRRCYHEFCWNCFVPMGGGNHFHTTTEQRNECQRKAAVAQQEVNQVHKDQAEKFKKVSKDIKPIQKLYQEEQKLRKNFMENSMTLVRLPAKMTMDSFRSLVRELGLARLLIVTTEIFSVYYEANPVFNKMYQERNLLELELNMYLNRMNHVVEGTDGSMVIFDVGKDVQTRRRSMSEAFADKLNRNEFEPIEKEVNVPLAPNAFRPRGVRIMGLNWGLGWGPINPGQLHRPPPMPYLQNYVANMPHPQIVHPLVLANQAIRPGYPVGQAMADQRIRAAAILRLQGFQQNNPNLQLNDHQRAQFIANLAPPVRNQLGQRFVQPPAALRQAPPLVHFLPLAPNLFDLQGAGQEGPALPARLQVNQFPQMAPVPFFDVPFAAPVAPPFAAPNPMAIAGFNAPPREQNMVNRGTEASLQRTLQRFEDQSRRDQQPR